MPEYVYTLSGLAEKEGVSYGYLRGKVHEMNTLGKPLVWRNYRFTKPGSEWLAIPLDADVEVL